MRGPAERSLKYLRKEGWTLVQVVEQWIPQAKKRRDLFGFADILCVHETWGHLYVQSTSGTNTRARVKKVLENEASMIVLETGAKIQVHGWRKLKRGGRPTWVPRIVEITLEDGELKDVEKKDT